MPTCTPAIHSPVITCTPATNSPFTTCTPATNSPVTTCIAHMYAGHYNGDKVNEAQEPWFNANASHIAEHNATSEIFQLGGTQFVDLSKEKCWVVA